MAFLFDELNIATSNSLENAGITVGDKVVNHQGSFLSEMMQKKSRNEKAAEIIIISVSSIILFGIASVIYKKVGKK